MRRMAALPAEIAERLVDVWMLCEKYYVKRLAIFGSAVKGTFDPRKSDVDFVVEFLPDPPGRGFRHPYFGLLEALGDLFGGKVDLVERSAIENPYFLQVLDLTQQPVYESNRAA